MDKVHKNPSEEALKLDVENSIEPDNDGNNDNTNNEPKTNKESTTDKANDKLKSLSVTQNDIEMNKINKDDPNDKKQGGGKTNTLNIPGDDIENGSSGEITHKQSIHSAALKLDDQYRINEKKHPLLRGYIRQDWEQVCGEEGEIEELRAEWVELFFDLM